jgi:hypothetical protein
MILLHHLLSLFTPHPTVTRASWPHPHIGPLPAAALILVALNAPASAQVISGTQITFGPVVFPTAQYRAIVEQEPNGNDTGVGFNFTGTSLQVTETTLDEGSDWYLVQPGDVFSAATIAANQFPGLIVLGGPRPPVAIPLGNFYLGVNTGTGFTSGVPNRQVFGWLELKQHRHTTAPHRQRRRLRRRRHHRRHDHPRPRARVAARARRRDSAVGDETPRHGSHGEKPISK